MTDPIRALEEAMGALAGFTMGRRELQEEIEAAKTEFFGAGALARLDGAGGAAAAGGRFLEWFCLERTLADGTPPLELFRRYGLPGIPRESLWVAGAWSASRPGVFQVEERTDGEVLEVLDLSTERRFPLAWPGDAPHAPQPGECLLGRIFPTAEEGAPWLPSTAMVLVQGQAVIAALSVDLARIHAEGGRARVGQDQLEQLIQAGARGGAEGEGERLALPDLLERIQLLFDRHGFVGLEAPELLEQAGRATGFAQVFGDLLNELAFDTDADLDEFRRLFTQLWSHVHTGAGTTPAEPDLPGASGAPGPVTGRSWSDPDAPCACGSGKPYEACCLGRDLVARLKEAEGRSEKLSGVFSGLAEVMGGLDDDDPGERISPLEEGLEEARSLLGEYLWEIGVDWEGREGAVFQGFLEFLAGAGERLGRPLRPRDLVGEPWRSWLLARFLTASPDHRDGLFAVARELFLPLGRWLHGEHGLESLEEAVREATDRFLPALERSARATDLLLAVSGPAEEGGEPRIYELFAVDSELHLRIWEAGGGGDDMGRLAGACDMDLVAGDLLIGALQTGAEGTSPAGPVRVVPVEAVALLDPRLLG